MYLFKAASKWLSKSSPLGLILAGTAVVAAAPAAKKFIRGAAVTLTRGVLAVAEGGAAVASDLKEGWEDVVAEAKSTSATSPNATGLDMGTVVGAGAGGALGASIGGMAGATGAMVGGGIGSVVGAGVGSGMTEAKEDNSSQPANNTETKKTKES